MLQINFSETILSIIQKTLMLSLAMSVSFFYSQNIEIPNKNTQRGFGQVDFLSITMPKEEVNMDFSGIHYNIKPTNWSYLGLGIYGAIGGLRGGFFTLGINAGIQQKLYKNVFLDTGIHFGGGGGASAPDGGGAFILPHINLGYDFKLLSTSVGYSYINFFDGGAIKSQQVYAAIQIPLSFDYSTFKHKEKRYSLDKLGTNDWNQNANKVSLLVHANNLNVQGDSKFSNGESIKGRTIRLAGFELNSYLTDHWFYFVKADGAYHGIKAGYMDVFVGAGYHFNVYKNTTHILAKFGVGAGGGGGVDTKGGFLIYPDISLEQKLFDHFYASINTGRLMSPDSHFSSSTWGLGIKYYAHKDGLKSKTHTFSKVKFKGLETIIKHDLYFDANRDGGFSQDMHQISFQVNFFFNKYIYGTGQTSFANFGNAGAYAEGIVGLGVRSKSFLNKKLSIYAQALGGAAGGGGISTGQGFIVKPSAGLNVKLNNKLNLRGGLGYVKAKGGVLSSPFANLGLSYNFSYLSAK